MATTKSWTDQQDTELVALHGQGLTQAECARRLGISNRRVSEHSKVIGLSWDRSKTKAATSARVADNKSMRSQIEAGLLADVQRLRGQMFAPCKAFNFGGKDNTYAEVDLEQPTFVDQLKIMQAATIAVDRSLKIAVHDSDSSHDDAKSMLTGLAAAMGLAFRTPQDAEQNSPQAEQDTP
jgi:transcriptional regulator with XRE-family HTH domain